jgi:hypothetical protein
MAPTQQLRLPEANAIGDGAGAGAGEDPDEAV